MKRNKSVSISKVHELFSDCPPDKAFFLNNGTYLRNMHELYDAVLNMQESVFLSHVNDEKNDFAEWIEHVIGDDELSSSLRGTKDRLKTILVLKSRIDELESVEHVLEDSDYAGNGSYDTAHDDNNYDAGVHSKDNSKDDELSVPLPSSFEKKVSDASFSSRLSGISKRAESNDEYEHERIHNDSYKGNEDDDKGNHENNEAVDEVSSHGFVSDDSEHEELQKALVPPPSSKKIIFEWELFFLGLVVGLVIGFFLVTWVVPLLN